jgi:hypothetical protein
MSTCSIEVGFLRKKPCGHAAVAACQNCEQPLCADHAIAQLTEGGKRTGKFMCKECTDAAKEYDKSMAAVAKTQDARKAAAAEKSLYEQAAAPAAPAKSVASAPAPAEAPKESGVIEFTPSSAPKKDGGS